MNDRGPLGHSRLLTLNILNKIKSEVRGLLSDKSERSMMQSFSRTKRHWLLLLLLK